MIFTSKALPSFWAAFDNLPPEIRERVEKQYRLFGQNPAHGSLQLKPVGEFWSVRVTESYRALAVRSGNEFTWFWIGAHDEYEQRIK